MTDDKIKPCPFCGERGMVVWMDQRSSADGDFKTAAVRCSKRCSGGPKTHQFPTEGEAIAAWNRRALPPEVRALVEAGRNALGLLNHLLHVDNITDQREQQLRNALAAVEPMMEGRD